MNHTNRGPFGNSPWQRRGQWDSGSPGSRPHYHSWGRGRGRGHVRPAIENTTWFPSRDLDDYDGPYPKNQLRAARNCLIETLERYDGEVLERVKPKIGIPSTYGPACPPPPQPSLVTPPRLETLPRPVSETESQHDVVFLGYTGPNTSQDSGISSAQGSAFDLSISDSTQSYLSSPGDKAEASTSSTSTLRDNFTTPTKETGSVVAHDNDSNSSFHSAAFFSGITPIKVQISKRQHDEKEEGMSGYVSKQRRFSSDELENSEFFKCDFCDNQCSDRNIMWNHLKASEHYSASVYASQCGSQVVDHVLKKCALKNKIGLYKTFVVACPDCSCIFEDMFQCGWHYQNKHGGDKKCYALCSVVQRETVWVYPDCKVCPTCKSSYESLTKLHAHWSKLTDHHPVTKVRPAGTVALFPCNFCPKVFFENYYVAENHALIAHGDKAQDTNVHAICAPAVPVKVRFIKMPSSEYRQEVPPCIEDLTCADSFQAEKELLKGLKSHYKHLGGKTNAKQIKGQMKYLKQFQNGNA